MLDFRQWCENNTPDNTFLDFKDSINKLAMSIGAFNHKVNQLQQIASSLTNGREMTSAEAGILLSSQKQLLEYQADLANKINAYNQSPILNKAKSVMTSQSPNYITSPLPPPPGKRGL